MPEDGRSPNNLPLQLTSFVGRVRELAMVEELLADHRLLTLTGPGGSGKTRLALTAASAMAEDFQDGIRLVELAPLSDPDLVPQAVASVLGVRGTPGTPLVDSLFLHLESREILLVVDNCEHLVGACASLAETLLRRCPELRILATSREAFGVPGEALFFVPPLSLPDPRRLPAVDGLLSYEAAGLSNLYTEGLELAAETGDRANAAYCPEGLATLIAARDEPERATRLFGASEALLEAVGAPLYAHAQDRALYDSAVEELRSRLGEGVFEAVWAEGRTMSPERAIGYALETPEPPEESEATPEYPAGLSAPEVEILKLVANGMTNAQIARELYISLRTVNAHMGSVYHKIGSSTRAEAARFASDHGLL